MTTRRRFGLSLLMLLGSVPLAGCGPSAGETYHVVIAELYYDVKDAEAGGPSDRWFTLARDGRMTYASNCGVKVMEAGEKWTKVEVMNGREKGAVGWLATGKLKRD